jgi:hypothetical protein
MNALTAHILASVIKTDPLPNPSADDPRLQLILTVVFTITGAISVLVVTIAGFRYIVSHGDPNIISQAKQTIIYALVGVVISISAVTIAQFVLKGL